MMLSLESTGLEELLTRFIGAGEATIRALEVTLYREAEKVMTKSKRLCPVSPGGGSLRSSGQVQKPVRLGNDVWVPMGYGNSSVDYAVYVHERLDLKHKSPTQAKFLEQPTLEVLPEIERAVAQALKEAYG